MSKMGLGKRYKAKSGWSYRRFPIKVGLKPPSLWFEHKRTLSKAYKIFV